MVNTRLFGLAGMFMFIGVASAMLSWYVTVYGYTTVSVNPNIMGWWTLNENSGQTAGDISQYGNHGILGSAYEEDTNDPLWTNDCKFGSCLYFDGNDDYLRIPTNMAFNKETIEFWMKPESTTGYVMTEGIPESGIRFWIKFVNNKLRWGVYSNVPPAGWKEVDSNDAIPTGEWVHVAAVIDSGITDGLRLYINGVEQSDTDTAGSNSPYGTLYIGTYIWPIGNHFHGTLDDIRIWNTTLTAEQIYSIYERGV